MKGIQDTTTLTYRQLVGNGLRYEIPKFQRDYAWEEEQWDDLWRDLEMLRKNEETDHYMGYLVLQSVDSKNYSVIDGQQRLTTLSIIILTGLKCLKDLIENNVDAENNQKRADALRNSYIGYIDPVTLITNNKLKLNKNSDDYYRRYLALLVELPLRNINSSEKQMRGCFLWYYEKVKKEFATGEEIAGFIDQLADKIFFTRISVSDDFNAFRVFETLNARGVQLSAADLLKNYLFSIVDESRPHNSEIDELELLWSKVIGKLGSHKFEDFLRHFWNSKHKTVRKTYLFKAIRNNISDKSQAFALIRELNEVADLYMALQNSDDELWHDKKEVASSLKDLALFQIKQTFSLFISGYRNLSANDFERLVKAAVVVSFRYNIIGGLNPNEQEDAYNSIALNMNETKKFSFQELKNIYVSDENFENSFSNKVFKNTTRNHKIVKYIFSKLEKYKYKNDIPADSDVFSVEHILPERADASWGDFDNEAINRSVYRLGNLTLLEKKLNKEAGVLKYDEKLEFYKKSNCKLTTSCAERFNEWNVNNLSSRQKELAKDAKSVWRIQF